MLTKLKKNHFRDYIKIEGRDINLKNKTFHLSLWLEDRIITCKD